MIIKELFGTRADGVNLYKSYSNEKYRIQQVETGITYDEAVDVETANYTYIETDEKLEEVM